MKYLFITLILLVTSCDHGQLEKSKVEISDINGHTWSYNIKGLYSSYAGDNEIQFESTQFRIVEKGNTALDTEEDEVVAEGIWKFNQKLQVLELFVQYSYKYCLPFSGLQRDIYSPKDRFYILRFDNLVKTYDHKIIAHVNHLYDQKLNKTLTLKERDITFENHETI